jgi:solute carrier family 25 carnitine/acylcarnitine transporter 20/29
MASPLLGIAAVNSLLFTAYSVSRRIVSPFPDLSIPQVGLAGAMAGVANATLASPGEQLPPPPLPDTSSKFNSPGFIVPIKLLTLPIVELFKIRMQGQYGDRGDRRLSKVFRDTWATHGFRHGVMKGFWATVVREVPAYGA